MADSVRYPPLRQYRCIIHARAETNCAYSDPSSPALQILAHHHHAFPHNGALLKSLGGTHVINHSLPASTIAAELARIAGGQHVEIVYDAVSVVDTQVLPYEVIAPGGSLLLTLARRSPRTRRRRTL